MQHQELELRTADGTSLYAQMWTPSGPIARAVAIVHGLGEHSGRYNEMAEFFASMGLMVLAYDHRGHGRSGGGLPSFEVLRSDIDVALEFLRRHGFAKPTLVGQSMGGGLVLQHALRFPASIGSAVAMSPMLRTAFPPPFWKLWLGRVVGNVWPSFTLRTGIDANDLSHDPEAVRAYLADPWVHRKISAALGLSMIAAGERSLEHAGELSVPLLLMHGTADRITSHRASEAFARDAGSWCRLQLWDGLAHDLHHELQRTDVLRYIVDWILVESSETHPAASPAS
jgi:alpha-beta hydrolase superfamily lysophospholipase